MEQQGRVSCPNYGESFSSNSKLDETPQHFEHLIELGRPQQAIQTNSHQACGANITSNMHAENTKAQNATII